EHAGINLHQGFESLRLRQKRQKSPVKAGLFLWEGDALVCPIDLLARVGQRVGQRRQAPLR
ncbi:MAG TPA: hypothetical protein PKC78_15085, partial [Accumulibacter sp.]|uniref:hypothetical protein n=1 Tax=Accumulibacter sp. TaxID=2053492 RepID=UPI002C389BB7